LGALSSEQRKLLEKSTLRYMNHLDEAAEYLEGRGLLEVARSSGLGVVRDPVPGHERYEGRLAIPYLTNAGPVNMSFRCLESHSCKTVAYHGKYEFMKGYGTTLYGVQAMEDADEWIAITEGELDALTLKVVGVPAIGVSGAEKWEDCWDLVLSDFSRVYAYTDGDSAAEDLWKSVARSHDQAIRVRMPDGEDVNSVYVKHGAEPLLAPLRRK